MATHAKIVDTERKPFSILAINSGSSSLRFTLFKAGESLAPILTGKFERIGLRDPARLYFEAAAVITVLVLLGHLLEARARNRTGQAIQSLLSLAAKTAHRITNGKEEDVPIADIARRRSQRRDFRNHRPR